MLIRYKSTGRTRNVVDFRAKALIRTGVAVAAKDELVKKNQYQTRALTAESNAAMVSDELFADELTSLREEYQAVIGKRAYHGWDAETLRQKITEASE